jgi:tRNA splicing endonuclease
VIPVKSEADSLYNDGYGNWDEKGVLTLDAYEALYNVEREKITVIDELDNNVFNFRDLVIFFSKTEPRTFTKFIVYKDLRNRGFVTQMID